MGVPFRTFTESTTTMAFLMASKVTAAECGTAFNIAHREAVAAYQWKARAQEGLLVTTADYADGTISLTQGSATVTGVGTVFTSGMAGLWFSAGAQGSFFQIATFTDATHVELEVAWPYDDVTDGAFTIFARTYSLPAVCGSPQLYLGGNDQAIEALDGLWHNLNDPLRDTTDSAPTRWVLRGVDATTRQQQIEFWPRPTAALAVRVYYDALADDLAGSQMPFVDSIMVELLGLHYACVMAHNKFGDARWIASANDFKSRYDERLDQEKQEDQRRHGLPRSVRWEQGTRSGDYYRITHDVE